MTFELCWKTEARKQYDKMRDAARQAYENREETGRKKSSKQEGLFKQVRKVIRLLAENPRHPGLQTHEMHSLPNPHKRGDKVFTCYAQHKTPSAYRVFWCYGPQKGELTVIAITSHP